MMSNSLFQNSYYISIACNGILYGIELVLYVQTMQALVQRGTKPSSTSRFFAIFNTAILLLATIFVAVQAVFAQEMWILNAGFKGGSAAYLGTHNSVWYRTLGTTVSIILQLMCDAFLIYRCFTVYNDFLVLVFPCILCVVALVFGILHLCYPSVLSGGLSAGLAAHIGVTYASISIGLNVIISCMICARVAYLGRVVHTSHTTEQKGMPRYTGTISIIVEAAILYAISGIAFVVSYGLGSGVSIIFFSIYIMCSCLSPQLIIMRIAGGKAWKQYRAITSPAVGVRVMTSVQITHSIDYGAKANSELQFRSPGSDLS